MKTLGTLSLSLFAVLPLMTSPARAADITTCAKEQLHGFTPKLDEMHNHRQFPLPFVSYPFGTKMEDWGFKLIVTIDESGRVACFQMTDKFSEEPLPLNDQRRALTTAFKDWRYTPFTRGGHPVATIVSEYINERELPQRSVPLPDVPLDKVTISLERQGCFGSCPAYKVTVSGNGKATYEGSGYVDVIGIHHYRIPPQNVAKLVDSLRAKELWSLRSEYTAGITDSATYILNIEAT